MSDLNFITDILHKWLESIINVTAWVVYRKKVSSTSLQPLHWNAVAASGKVAAPSFFSYLSAGGGGGGVRTS